MEEALLGLHERGTGLEQTHWMARHKQCRDIALYAPPPGEPATYESLILIWVDPMPST